MCGRYVVAGVHELSERFQLRSVPENLVPTSNAAPSQQLPVIFEDAAGERELRLMHWGLIPRWRKAGGDRTLAPINARAETLLEKPMFRNLIRRHRCIVPANGFYEWAPVDGRKHPYYVTLRDGGLFGLAGLYDETEGPDGERSGSYTIVTSAPNELVAPLHNRMAVILRREDEAEWISRDVTDPVQVERLLRPYPAAEMLVYPVGLAVNSPRNNDPTLIEPVDAPSGAARPERRRVG